MSTQAAQGRQSIPGRIRERYAELPPAERRLADVMLDFPGDLASYSASELARIASVSNAAASRLVQRLGFRNFEELRLLSRDAKAAGSPLFLIGRSDGDDSTTGHVGTSIANISGTFQRIDGTILDEIVGAIAEARRVWLLGVRNGHFLAGYLRWQFVQVRGDVHLLPAAGETLGEAAAGFEPEDLVVVFGLRRRVPVLGRVVAAARRAGARIVYIADHDMTENPGATWTLRCDTRAPSPLDNHASVLVLCHALADRLIQRMGARGRQRLARIEELHESLDEL